MLSVTRLVDELAAAVPPSSGAIVMSTGIVSMGLSADGREAVSRVLAALAGAVWIILGVQLLVLACRQRRLLLEQARLPGALTWIAGTSVLGTRLALLGWDGEAVALLGVGLLFWLFLVPRVLASWRRPTAGVSFMLTVATESLAVLGAALALAYHAAWLAAGALACVGLGLAFYLFVLSAFDLRQLLAGRGDHWVSGGALAIAALACAWAAEVASRVAPLRPASADLATAALGIWAAAFVWLPALLAGELAARRGGYDVRRWSTVFPVGMYAVCSFAVAQVQASSGIEDFARVWIWVALLVWVVVGAGLVRRVGAALATAVARAAATSGT